MRRIGKWLGRALLAVIILGAALWVFGPYEPVNTKVSFDAAALGDDPAAYLAAQEAKFDDIRPGAAKRIVWAGDPGAKTPISVVYFHGFSASAEEIRPVPDRIAQALGANLVFTRFTGHGRSGDAMAEATAERWMQDAAEAMAVARAVGDEVLVLSTSTGGTIAALTALDPEMSKGIKGMAFVSPNFGINNPAAPLLTMPAARYWLPSLVGAERSFEPRNEGQAAHWTTRYPSVAALPLAALVKYANAQDFSGLTIPALFHFSQHDKVVVPARTQDIADRWGGPVTLSEPKLGPEDDAFAHVITGDIVSPGQTDAVVDLVLAWFGEL